MRAPGEGPFPPPGQVSLAETRLHRRENPVEEGQELFRHDVLDGGGHRGSGLKELTLPLIVLRLERVRLIIACGPAPMFYFVKPTRFKSHPDAIYLGHSASAH